MSGRRAGIFEDPVVTTATAQELTDAKDRKSAYQKAVPLAAGTYKVDVIVRDVASGATGIRHVGFTVPKYDPQKLSTSTLVLAAKLESLVDQPAVGQFVIGQKTWSLIFTAKLTKLTRSIFVITCDSAIHAVVSSPFSIRCTIRSRFGVMKRWAHHSIRQRFQPRRRLVPHSQFGMSGNSQRWQLCGNSLPARPFGCEARQPLPSCCCACSGS